MYNIENFISERGDAYMQNYVWGYTTCVDLKNIDRLNALRKVLDFYNLQNLYGGECLNDDDVESLFSEIKTLTLNCNANSLNFSVDKSKKDFWMVENPHCTITPHYIKYCESLVCKIEVGEFSVEDVSNVCKIDLNIKAEEIPCELKANIFVIQQNCDLDFNIEVKEEDCEIQHEILVNEIGCDISLENYKNKVKALIKN